MQDLEDYSALLYKNMDKKISGYRHRTERFAETLRLLSPAGKIKEQYLRMDQYEDTLKALMDRRIVSLRHRLDIDIEKLKGLSPLDRLKGGYSYATDGKGRNVRRISDVSEGDMIEVYVTDGAIEATVTGSRLIDRN